jgi:Protein involved in formate dehydrogenase formation
MPPSGFSVDLRDDWADVLGRRRDLATSLIPYGPVIDAWAAWTPPAPRPPSWAANDCDARWRRGLPLLAQAALPVDGPDVEDVLAVAMEALTAVRPEEAAGMRRLADAWDAGELGIAAFLPTEGAIGAAAARHLDLAASVIGFVATAGLRPAVQWCVVEARDFLTDGRWTLGVCPFCGAPPGVADIIEDGRRRLGCHLCGGTWIFSRVRCPLCGADGPGDLHRLEPGGADEAYFISACTRCKGYVKEIDRRQRWNARAGLVEDWASPHFDLVARRAGHWRPVPTLVDIAGLS